MNGLIAGALGAVTTNALHESFRRVMPDAPRIDLLGMQALSKVLGTGYAPKGRALYITTLVGDVVSNSIYFSLIGLAPAAHRVKTGIFAGALAGAGAVVLPSRLGLSETPSGRTTTTKVLSVALYLSGGLVTGLALRE